jgi:hypothetical protein
MAAVPAFESEVGPEAGLLDAVRASKRAEMAEQVRQLRLVIEWCAAHEVDETEAATYVEFGKETGLALAGEGAPFVSEFAVTELATALNMTTDAGKRYVGKVLEVRYRLPGFWAEVVAGRLAWWRAARVAEHTMPLPAEGAAFVDGQLARFAAKVAFGQVERLVEEALVRFAPEEAEAKRRAALDGRHLDVHLDQVGHDGKVDLTGTLDLADAVDFDTAIGQGAAELKQLGCEESLDVRRSMAAGLLARRQTTLDLNPDHPANDPTSRPGSEVDVEGDMEAARGTGLVKPRQAVIHVHTFDQDIARCETTRSPIGVDQVKSWCADPDTQVVIRPVVDLNDHIHVDRYEVPDRLDHQVSERDLTCCFPFCTRPAVRCDDDHCVPYDSGGPTCSCNIAPCCRGHHRIKTHGEWSYRFLSPGAYLWVSPAGYWYHRDGTGTLDLGHHGPAGDGFGDPPHP